MTRSMTCHCQAVLSAEDTDSLIGPTKDHFDREHPELGLSVSNVRNYLESEDRSTGPVDRIEEFGDVEIRPVTPDSAPDVIGFFDTDAFPDNPAWGACYCMFFPRGGRGNENWGEEPWQENRREQMARIREGKTTGMLAYVGGRMVGWCNATARSELPGFADGQDEGVVSVVCFAIAPPYRGHGIATRLLEGAIAASPGTGATRLEAYPVREPQDERAAFHGSLELFQGLGFEVTSEDPLVVSLDVR
ncbi:MAG: GNAT family N-acetyltransferase [Acidimicrobiia bacterium]